MSILHLEEVNNKSMKKILVPVDFSEQSMNAFRFALDLAARAGGGIGLLHVVPLPVLKSPLIDMKDFKKTLIEELEQAAHLQFLKMMHEYNSENITVETEVIIANDLHKTIIDYAKRENFDLLIMGTKGAKGIREWMVGSNAEKIVRSAPIPVIAVKDYIPGLRIKNIVFPNTLDTNNQEDLLMKIKALQNLFQARLHIIWVNTPSVFKPDHEIRQRLNAFAQRFMLKDYDINVFNFTDEEAGILEYTRQVNGDLIAMGTHGLKGLAHLISGSIAEDVVNHVEYPVWTYCTKAAFQTHLG